MQRSPSSLEERPARKNRGARKKRARRRGRRALLPPTPSTSSHRGCDHPAPLREETAATRRRERGFPLATRAPATGARSRDGAEVRAHVTCVCNTASQGQELAPHFTDSGMLRFTTPVDAVTWLGVF